MNHGPCAVHDSHLVATLEDRLVPSNHELVHAHHTRRPILRCLQYGHQIRVKHLLPRMCKHVHATLAALASRRFGEWCPAYKDVTLARRGELSAGHLHRFPMRSI